MIEIRRGNGQPASARHGVAGVQRQVEKDHLNLRSVNECIPEVRVEPRLDPYMRTDSAAQHVAHAADDVVRIERRSLKPLPAGKGKQLRGQLSTTFGRLQCIASKLAKPLVVGSAAQQVEGSHASRGELVETVGK